MTAIYWQQKTLLSLVKLFAHQKLRRPILGILRALVLAYLAEVPHMEAPVSAGTGEDCFVVGGPLHLKMVQQQ